MPLAEKKKQKPRIADKVLLQRHIDGDPEAFSALVKRYQQELYAFLARYTGSGALADDVFQDAFLQVHLSAGQFDFSRSFRPWLYTIAVNKARDALRRRGRHTAAPLDATVGSGEGTTTFADLLPSDVPDPQEISANLETRQHVQRVVSELPENLRAVLALSYFQQMPYKEIADVLSLPLGTVKSRLHAAVKHFAEKWTAWAAKQNRRPESDPASSEGSDDAQRLRDVPYGGDEAEDNE